MSFDLPTFLDALFSWPFLQGALLTLGLTVAAHLAAILIAAPLAVLLNGPTSAFRKLVTAYVGFFRAVPTLLQLLFVWNALPQIFPIFREDWFTPFLAAWIALSVNESAYQVEINRAALSSVDAGQMAAGQAIGLKKTHIYRYILLPQALRVALPPTMNEFITLLKLTSLASIISLQELMTVTQINVARTFQFSEYYAVALTWYLAMVYSLMGLQKLVERRFRWESRVDANALAESRRGRGW